MVVIAVFVLDIGLIGVLQTLVYRIGYRRADGGFSPNTGYLAHQR